MRKVSILIPFIRDPSKTIEAIKANAPSTQFEIVKEEDKERIGFPKMFNKLVKKAKYDLVMFIADDIIPQEGFFENALKAMDLLPDKWGMVGLNDQFHDGWKLATHWLISKKMIPLLGGEILHTGYWHCYCDQELLLRSRKLGRYIWAEDAKLFHDHPILTHKPVTGDYAKINGKEWMEHDKKLFLERNPPRQKNPDSPYNVKKKESVQEVGKTSDYVVLGMPLGRDFKVDIVTAMYFTIHSLQSPRREAKVVPSPSAAIGRTTIIKEVLENKEATHLFLLDSDTRPPADTIERLLAHDKDIVAGVTPMIISGNLVWSAARDTKDGLYLWYGFNDLPKKLFQTTCIGGTTLLIKRKVLEAMEWPYYVEQYKDVDGDQRRSGEDVYFCEKAIKLGFEIWVDPSIKCGHQQTKDLLQLFKLDGNEDKTVKNKDRVASLV